jgi:hypothetical protein
VKASLSIDNESILVTIQQKFNSRDVHVCLFPVKDSSEDEDEAEDAKAFLRDNEQYKHPKEFHI